jgi:hypothetical protein
VATPRSKKEAVPFLKKRTKKLLFVSVRSSRADRATNMQEFLVLFFKKERLPPSV